MTGQKPSPTWRFILCETRSAAENMAIDEMLLRRGEGATIRFYHFLRPSVTLGYEKDPSIVRYGGVLKEDVVRRITGGNAVYHGTDDLTYSVCAPLELFGTKKDLRKVYDTVRSWIIRGLNSIDGLVVSSHGQNDIVTNEGKKICGNAIRVDRSNNYVLVHGSIFVGSTAQQWASALDFPEESLHTKLARVADYDPRENLLLLVGPILLQSFASNDIVNGQMITGGYSGEELKTMQELLHSRYKNPQWLQSGAVKGTVCAADIRDD